MKTAISHEEITNDSDFSNISLSPLYVRTNLRVQSHFTSSYVLNILTKSSKVTWILSFVAFSLSFAISLTLLQSMCPTGLKAINFLGGFHTWPLASNKTKTIIISYDCRLFNTSRTVLLLVCIHCNCQSHNPCIRPL